MARRARLALLFAVSAIAVLAPASSSHALPPIKLTLVAGAPINQPADILATADGGFLIADNASHKIRQVGPDGTMTTVAGTGAAGFSGDGGAATLAELHHPEALAPLPGGGFAFADSHNYRIRRVWPDGHISTMAGNGDTVPIGSGDTASTIGFRYISGLDSLPDGTLLVAEAEPESIVVVAPDGSITRPGIAASRVAVDGDGGYFAASREQRLIKHVAADGTVTTVAGNGDPATDAELAGEDADDVGIGEPLGLAATPDGGVEFWSFDAGTLARGQLLRVTSDGKIHTVWRKMTVVTGMSRSPEGLLLADRGNSEVYLLHKTFLQFGPPSTPQPGQSNASPSFTFSSPEPDATFECKLDQGAWEDCDAPTKQLSEVADGDHVFRVRATDAGDVTDPSPATWNWRTDATGPEPFALADPSDGAATGTRPTLSWSPTTDAWSSVANYEVRLDGAKVADVAPSACGSTCSWTAPTLPDGTHTWRIVAVDVPGNERASAQRSFTVAATPTASFTVTPSLALTGQTVSFDASASTVENGAIAGYQWDLDGDGSFETDSGASPAVSRSYGAVGLLHPALRVRTGAGATDTTDRPLDIRLAPPPGPVGASINGGDQFTNDPDVELVVRWPAFTLNATLSNDGGFAGASVVPVTETIPWTLLSSGSERLPKTVYVRFDDSTQTFQDDIILDQTPPTVRRASKVSRRLLVVKASDNVSGVAEMQITRNRRAPRPWERYRTRVKLGRSSRTAWVRVRDSAGNESRWRAVRATRQS